MRVLLVAGEAAGINVLRALARTDHDVVAALTEQPTRVGTATAASVAEGLGVTVLASRSVRDPTFAGWVDENGVDLLLNVHSLHVVHADVLAAPLIGSFNLHPGPLPEYAGLNVPSWAIVNRESSHGVTVHWMEAGIDTGPIAYTTAFELTELDTGLTVAMRCAREGFELVMRLVETSAADPGTIPRVPQDLGRRRYYTSGPPDEGWIDWTRSGRDIVALIRACDYAPFPSPWGHTRARWQGRELDVLKASRTEEKASAPPGTVGLVGEGSATVATGDEWIRVSRVRYRGTSVNADTLLAAGDRLEGKV